MKVDISTASLAIYEALASKVRIQVIHLLAKQPMNISELAKALGLSNAIMTMHVKKLEKAGIIRTEMKPGKAGVQKMCVLAVDKMEIEFPSTNRHAREFIETVVSIGHYTDFDIWPTCGLATTEKIIGEFDEPRYFLDANRVNAKILWFRKGFVEYKIANFLIAGKKPLELDISLELSSEAPFTNHDWPSDISFYLNDVTLGKWTSPGDFGDIRGKYTPDWWPSVVNQYGLLKQLKINGKGTFMDGTKISDVTLDQVHIERKHWTFRLAVHDDAEHVGGLTLFGSGFGNYDQDIIFRLYYLKNQAPSPEQA